MVEVSHLMKKYDGHVAVDDITFTLLPGSIYGLLGPNGAGKSTTMNMMTGYIAPNGGSVSVDGHDIYKDGKEAKRRIGYLPENPPLYQDMTVHEYLMFVAELKGVKKEDRLVAVEGVMEDAGLLDVADRLIRSLSKGYRQRVGFAGAIVNDPSVIILDEPTVGLDPKQIIEFREMIRRLGEEHIVLLSSHILSEISAVCDHVFIINGGKLIVDDAVENLDSYVDDGRRVDITIKGDAENAVAALSALPGVTEVTLGELREDEARVLSVRTEATEDMTEQISLALMEQRIPILGMQEVKGSLEQIFLEITEEDASAVSGDVEEEDVSESAENADSDPEGTDPGTGDEPVGDADSSEQETEESAVLDEKEPSAAWDGMDNGTEGSAQEHEDKEENA